MKSTLLDKIYIDEQDVDVKERILLVRQVIADKQHIESIAQELHKSRAWAYKWYKRCSDKGLEGLKEVQNESIFIHNLYIKRKWIVKQKRPIVTVTGTHNKTIIFGALSKDGKQFFR